MTAIATYEADTAILHETEGTPLFQNSDEQGMIDTGERPDLSEQHMLVMRALQGDQEAFGAIVDHYSTLMLRTACMIVKDRDIAEDVVQDALIQAWNHLSSLREPGALKPWLMRIVVNQCISFKRRLARTTAFMRQSLSEQERDLIARSADHHKGRLERDWDLAKAIEDLPAKQRTAIVLHYYSGMTLLEMSQSLQVSENTLKKRIQAALAHLRRVLRAADMDELPEHLQEPPSPHTPLLPYHTTESSTRICSGTYPFAA